MQNDGSTQVLASYLIFCPPPPGLYRSHFHANRLRVELRNNGSPAISQKPHAGLVPYPSQGHVTPLMSLAKLLHAKGFYITFVNTEFNHKRLIKSKGPDSVKGLEDFKFETIPDGLQPSDTDGTQDVPRQSDSTRKNCLVPFKELLVRLNSSSEGPPVSCVISDGVMSFGIKAAADLGVPQVQFWTASACSFIGYLHYRELIKRGIFVRVSSHN